ncbi:hypothetical protein K1W54_14900 [Micromonospora sp. CPCC 205371]|nr:hypothetical protein [Micromonospora sp. CPCC 205371]
MRRWLITITIGLLALAAGTPAAAHTEAAILAPGVISSDQEEWRISFTPDGRTAYFGRGADFFPVSRQATIVVSHATGSGWSTPRTASFSGQHPDIDPFVTADGRRLFWSSIRPVDGQARADADLWMVDRRRDGRWGEPRHLGAAVNSPADELYPTVTADGTLYFASDRAGGLGGWDIYRSRPGHDGRYGPAENLGSPVNTDGWEFNPLVVGPLLVFTGLNRAGGYGAGDLWYSVAAGGAWSTPRNLGPTVNTALDEYHPSVSPSFDRLYFVRHNYDPWVPGDIYTVRTRDLRGLLS